MCFWIHYASPLTYVDFSVNLFLNLHPHVNITYTKVQSLHRYFLPSVETTWCSEGPGCSLGAPAPEAVESSRRGGGESSRAEETEEDSARPLQHAAGQRAAGRVSTMCTVHIHTRFSQFSQQMHFGCRWCSTLVRIFFLEMATHRVCLCLCLQSGVPE